ncbi:MAG: hypothetical protein K6E99_04645 [Bacilli bacterium]|nr:hypothetical protein [Bacilli bacterium]
MGDLGQYIKVVIYMMAGLILVYSSYEDIKKMKINIIPLFVASVVFSITIFVIDRDMPMFTFFIPVSILFLLSVISGNQIGIGDGFAIMIIGAAGGLSLQLSSLFISILIAFFYSIYILLIKHKGKNYSFPFLPFITIGYFVSIAEKLISY